MHSRAIRWVLASLLVFTASFSYAEFKVAVVVATQAIFESEEAKSKISDLEATLKPQQERLETLNKELGDLRDKLIRDEAVMSDQAKRDEQKSLENKQIELDFGLQQYRKAVQDGQEKIMSELIPVFNAVVQDLVDLEGYDIVMNHQPNTQFFLYVNVKHDITRKVTEGINNRLISGTANAATE